MGYVVSQHVTVLLDIVAWACFHASTGYLAHRLPSHRLSTDWWLHRERRIERGGRFYVDVLRIKRWKHLLPEAGAVFAGGFDKKHLRSRDRTYLERYVLETRRAEIGHWLCFACGPLFVLWNPWPIALFMVAYGAVANGPCIASLRFNRLRLRRILEKTCVTY